MQRAFAGASPSSVRVSGGESGVSGGKSGGVIDCVGAGSRSAIAGDACIKHFWVNDTGWIR